MLSHELVEERLLGFYLEHAVQDGRSTRTGDLLTISKRMHFVEVAPGGEYQNAGAAPYLDYRPIHEDEHALGEAELDASWLRKSWDDEVMGYAITRIVPRHVEEVRGQRLSQVEKTEREVKARLTKEISYWDRRAQDLRRVEPVELLAGVTGAFLVFVGPSGHVQVDRIQGVAGGIIDLGSDPHHQVVGPDWSRPPLQRGFHAGYSVSGQREFGCLVTDRAADQPSPWERSFFASPAA